MDKWELSKVICDACGEQARYRYENNLNAYYEEDLCESCAWVILIERIIDDFNFEEVIEALGYNEYWGLI